jgi:hypothetical protein
MEDAMRRGLMWIVAGGMILVAAYGGKALATPASGFTGTTIAVGRFGEIDVANHMVMDALPDSRAKRVWLSLQKTKGESDVYVQSNVWTPGGSTGWHTHPGHSLIIVTAGAVTAYDGDDPSCAPAVYTTGMGFVDRGGDHVHLLRNEGAVEARTIAVQLIAAGATRRIDAPASPACSF